MPTRATPADRVAAHDTDVLVVGAGPTGMALALWLARDGLRVRIVDASHEAGTTSRATVVHARTLELYRQLGIADRVVDGGVRIGAGNVWVRGRCVTRVAFGDLGAGLSGFPFILGFPQDQHERLLVDALAEAGVTIERDTRLTSLEEYGERVVAWLQRADGTEETCTTRYLAGCDGAHSGVRKSLGIGFDGGTYASVFYVADVDGSGPALNGEVHIALDEGEFLAVFPMRGAGRARLVGQVRVDAFEASMTRTDTMSTDASLAPSTAPSLTWDDVRGAVAARMGLDVRAVHWFATYRVHHRVASAFRSGPTGRVFLLGDAGHIHSPVGGQGMNTGIGDACNLAWKLSAVVRRRASTALLNSYEPERLAFARELVATTDRAFAVVTSDGAVARFVRMRVVPLVFPALFALDAMRRLLFRTLSQIEIAYPTSPISEGTAGRLHAGERLPWVALRDADGAPSDSHAPLASRDWQVHVYGEATRALRTMCERRSLPLHIFRWQLGMLEAGFSQGAAYLVRPDGYVGFADEDASPGPLEEYLDSHAVRLAEA